MRIWWGRPVGMVTSSREAYRFGKPADDTDVACRRPAVGAIGVDGLGQTVGHRPDGRVDRERVRHRGPRGQGQVDLEDAPLEHGRGQQPRGGPVPREQDGPGSAAAEAMERRTARPVAPADEMEQGLLEEEAAGKDRQAGGLVENEDVVVLVEDREIRGRGRFLPGQAMVEERVAPGKEVIGRCGRSVAADLARLDHAAPLGFRRMEVAPGVERQNCGPFVETRYAVGVTIALVLHDVQRGSPLRLFPAIRPSRRTPPSACRPGSSRRRPCTRGPGRRGRS